MARSAVDDYIRALNEALLEAGVGRRDRRRLVRECRLHLELEVQRLHADGLTVEVAAARAVASFGSAGDLAHEWSAATGGAGGVAVRWSVACVVAMLAAAPAVLPAGRLADAWVGMMLILPAAGLVFGAVLGGAQGWAVGRRSGKLVRWVLGTGLGVGLGLTAATVLVEALGFERDRGLSELLGLALLGAVTGAVTGVLQWAFSDAGRRRPVGWIGAWTMGFALGLATAGPVVAALGRSGALADLPWFLVSGGLGATVAVLISSEARSQLSEPSGTASC